MTVLEIQKDRKCSQNWAGSNYG